MCGVHTCVESMHMWGACMCGVHACVGVHPCVGYMHVWVHVCVGNGQVLAVGLCEQQACVGSRCLGCMHVWAVGMCGVSVCVHLCGEHMKRRENSLLEIMLT